MTPVRREFFRWALVVAGVAAVVQVVEGPPGGGYGWGSVVVGGLLVAAPLVAVGYLVRTGDPGRAPVTTIVAGGCALLVAVTLVGNWAAAPWLNRILDVVAGGAALAVYGAAVLLELPLLLARRRDGA